MFAFVLSALIAAAGEPAYLASCPAEPGRVLATAPVPVSDDSIHPTNRRARFFLDLGSDGRIRRAALVESSGDATFDAAALVAVKLFRFAPPSQGCMSSSSVLPEDFNVPLISLARPAPGSTGGYEIPKAQAPAAIAICTAPFVQLTGIDVPDSRQPAGTVAVDVALDANARATSAKLAQSSGNPKLDAFATAAARSAQYAFTLPPGCPPRATDYRLELTFK